MTNQHNGHKARVKRSQWAVPSPPQAEIAVSVNHKETTCACESAGQDNLDRHFPFWVWEYRM